MKVFSAKFSYIGLLVFLLFACGGEKISPQQYYQKALEFKSKNELNSAIISLKNAIQADRNFAKARITLGEIYVEIGNGVSAEKELERAITLEGRSEELERLLVKSLLLQNKFDDVISKIKIEPSYSDDVKTEILVAQANAFIALDNKTEARKNVLDALKIRPGFKDAQLAEIKLLVMGGEQKKAQFQLDNLLKDHSGFNSAWILRAQMFLYEGQLAEAEKAFQLVLTQTDKRWMTSLRFEASLGVIHTQIMQDRLEPANKNIDQLRQRVPKHPSIKYLAAMINYRNKDYASASANLLEVVSIAPEHMPSHLLLGASLFALGSYEQADSFLSRFVNRVPSHIQARKLLAATRMKQNRPVEAIEMLSPLIDDETTDEELLAMVGKASLSSGAVVKGMSYLRKASKTAPDNIALRTELAKMYLNQGGVDQAVQELMTLPAAQAKQRDVLLVLANLKKHDIKSARKLIQKLLKESATPSSYTLAGGVELVDGARLAADAYFKKALEIKGDFVPALNYQAQLALEDDEIGKAHRLYDRILDKSPENLTALMGMAQIAEKRSEPDNTVAFLEKARRSNINAPQPNQILTRYYLATGQKDKAIGVAKEYVEKTLNSPYALALMAGVQMAVGDSDDALKTVQSLVKVQPDSPTGYVELAKVQLRLKDGSGARTSLERAMSLQPENVGTKVMLAMLELKTKNFTAAERIATELRKNHPKLGIGYQLAGDGEMAQGKYEKAIDWYEKGLKKQKSKSLMFQLVSAYSKSKQDVKAINQVKSWATENPTDTSILFVLAQMQQRTGDAKGSINTLEKALNKQPDNVAGLNNLAWLYYETNNVKAFATAKKAYELKSNAGEIVDTYGWIMLNTGGDKQQALSLLENAMAQLPKNVEIQYHVASALHQIGQDQRAKALLEKVVQSEEDFVGLLHAKELLSGMTAE